MLFFKRNLEEKFLKKKLKIYKIIINKYFYINFINKNFLIL